MLRSAEEIAAQVFNSYAFSRNEREAMVKVINLARKEAIEECRVIIHEADRLLNRAYNNNHDDMGWDQDYQEYIDKQHTINLLNQIK